MEYLWLLLLTVVLVAGWVLTLFSLPGNWVMVGAAALYAWLAPPEASLTMGWQVVLVLLGLAVVGEVVEFAAGAVGTARAGGSRRAALLAIVGSVVGGAAGAIVGLPIPVVGQIAAALLFAAGGALAGALLGEAWKGRGLAESWEVGRAAFWGRLWGALAKTTIGSVMVVIAIVAAIVP